MQHSPRSGSTPVAAVGGRRATPRAIRIAGLVVLVVFGGIGVLLSAFGAHTMIRAERRYWTSARVPATLLEVALRDTVYGARSRSRPSEYLAVLRHRYEVDGRVYESTRAYPFGGRLPGWHAESLTAGMRPGQRIMTNVPSGEPAAAFLVARRPRHYWRTYASAMVVGLGFLAFGVFFWRLARLAARQQGTATPAWVGAER